MILNYDDALIKDLHNSLTNVLENLKALDNSDNCPSCGYEYFLGDECCPEADCAINVASTLLKKTKRYFNMRELSGLLTYVP